MTNIEKIRDALVVGIDLAKSAGWTRHQKDEVAEAEEALRLFDEMMDQGSDSLPPPTQDVEQFIADHSDYAYLLFDEEVVTADDLRSWMTGHVRVPVELLERRFVSKSTADQCRAEAEILDILEALNASKGE